MKNPISICLSFLFFIGTSFYLNAQIQSERELLAKLVEEEQEAVNALILYPKDVRKVILESSIHVEALIKIESIQSNTSESFLQIIENFPKEVQKMLWDLTRYPDLISRITYEGPGYASNILNNYPEVIHDRAQRAVNDYYDVLIKIDELNTAAAVAFESVLMDYPKEVRENMRALIELPEVLSILTENIKMTILVGDIYEKDPEWILHKVDSLNLELVRANAQQLEDWKESLENDPNAFEELQEAAESYTEAYDYDDEYYSYMGDDLYYDESGDRYYNAEEEEVVIQHHYYYHYPYWFGYPDWYEYPCWRPRPYWHDWGFYYRPGRRIVVIGLPSFHFTHWYFGYAHHHVHWSYLSTHFVRHYHRYPRAHNSITTSVTVWRNRNAEIISPRWLENDGQLTRRFVEYGKFESSRSKYNQRNPKRQVSQKEFITKNSPRYPTLSRSSAEIIQENPRRKIDSRRIEPKKKTDRSDIISSDRYKAPNKETIDSKRTKTIKPKSIPKVNRGKDLHRDTWEKHKRKTVTTPKASNRLKTTKIKPAKSKAPTKKVTTKRKTTKRKTN